MSWRRKSWGGQLRRRAGIGEGERRASRIPPGEPGARGERRIVAAVGKLHEMLDKAGRRYGYHESFREAATLTRILPPSISWRCFSETLRHLMRQSRPQLTVYFFKDVKQRLATTIADVLLRN